MDDVRNTLLVAREWFGCRNWFDGSGFLQGTGGGRVSFPSWEADSGSKAARPLLAGAEQMREELRPPPKIYRAENVRQGDIVLRKPWQRVVFLIGLIAPFVLLLGWLLSLGFTT